MMDQTTKAIRKVAERIAKDPTAATVHDAERLARAVLMLLKER